MIEIDETVWTRMGPKSQRREIKGTGKGARETGRMLREMNKILEWRRDGETSREGRRSVTRKKKIKVSTAGIYKYKRRILIMCTYLIKK